MGGGREVRRWGAMGVVVEEQWRWEGGRGGVMGMVWGVMSCEDGRGRETWEKPCL